MPHAPQRPCAGKLTGCQTRGPFHGPKTDGLLKSKQELKTSGTHNIKKSGTQESGRSMIHEIYNAKRSQNRATEEATNE